nr:MAG TPA: hypothetical protein [Caudoviricetes sp.]
MTKAGIRLIFRSKEPEELSIGVYGYKYTVSPILTAKITSKSFLTDDKSSINQNTNLEIKFDIPLVNDSTDRVSRISHVLYMGSYFKVDSVRPYPPRVVMTIKEPEISDLKGQLDDIVNKVRQKSQNDVKNDAYNSLNIKDSSDALDGKLNKGDLVLVDSVINIWTGDKLIPLLAFIKEKLEV